MKQKRLTGRRILYASLLSLLALALCPLFRAAPAQAHSVYIFAWAEQERLCSESYFGRKSKVRQGRVAVYGADGQLLATGLTDDEGLACFPVPEKAGDLLFEINAGQGHRATFLLPAAEIEGFAGQAETPSRQGAGDMQPSPGGEPRESKFPAPAADGGGTGGAAEKAPEVDGAGQDFSGDGGTAANNLAAASLSPALEALVREVVRDEVRREIAPLRKSLLEARAPDGPGWRDIVGGLGWIAGLTGLAAWFASRKGRP